VLRQFDLPQADADVLILAGDVDVGLRGMEMAKRWRARLPVIYVVVGMAAAAAAMNDFRTIRVSPGFRRLQPRDLEALHARSTGPTR
jgi:hypothetical protein